MVENGLARHSGEPLSPPGPLTILDGERQDQAKSEPSLLSMEPKSPALRGAGFAASGLRL